MLGLGRFARRGGCAARAALAPRARAFRTLNRKDLRKWCSALQAGGSVKTTKTVVERLIPLIENALMITSAETVEKRLQQHNLLKEWNVDNLARFVEGGKVDIYAFGQHVDAYEKVRTKNRHDSARSEKYKLLYEEQLNHELEAGAASQRSSDDGPTFKKRVG
ncbi:hypothetical protein M885DRAFT_545560 [Pelagophyceae sp. CCMP2097]|nr:hypothetical protein M885DRAFT_545560 [Pelagophyceae sp. CCMP2097]